MILPRHSPCLQPRDLAALGRALLSPPPPEGALTAPFAAWLPGRRLVPTPTGRHALWLFLEHAGLRPGDEVLVAAYNFHVVVRLLVQRGLVPVFVDVDPDTLCMDPGQLEASVGPKARLVILTHMFGHPAPADAIARICRERGLLLFEDCAHALATRCSRAEGDALPAGCFGDGALFSFGIFKILDTLGGGLLALPEGDARVPARPFPRPGLLTGAGDPLERLVVSLLLHPRPYSALLDPLLRAVPSLVPRLHPSDPDPDYRFDPADRHLYRRPLASLSRPQLGRLEAGVRRRRAIAARVAEAVADHPALRPLAPDRHGRSNGSYLGLRCADPVGAARHLALRGVDSAPREFTDCSALPGFAPWGRACAGAREADAHTLRLPSFPCMSEAQLGRMLDALEGWRP